MKKLAIYDIDGTLLEGESQQHLMKYLLKNRYISYVRYLIVLPWFIAYKIGIAKDPKPALQFALKGLRGMTTEKFSALLDHFVTSDLTHHIFRSAKILIEKDRADGFQIVFVSNAIYPLVQAFSKLFNPDKIFATELETVGNIYSGNIKGPLMRGKVKPETIASYAAYINASLSNSKAYGDHASDIPLLSSVGIAIAVNPDSTMSKMAQVKGWTVINSSIQ